MRSQRVARPILERGMEAASGKKRTPQHEGVIEGRGGNGRKSPPPHTMCHTPHWASAGRVAFYYFVFLKRRKCIRGHFLGVFGIRSGPSQGFSRIRRGIRRHPRVRWQIRESQWLLFRTLPCDGRCCLAEIARACNHSSCFKFSSSQYPLENYKLRNMVRFRAILCWGYLSSVNVCNFIDDLGVSDSIEISRLRYHVKTQARRGSSFSGLGLEPNHTGWTAQSLFFLEESCRVKRSDTQTFSNFSNYFKRVLKLSKRSSSFSK